MIALQSQVNPHFICNILTIIKAMSKEQDTEKIGQICDYLARMLRYISAYDEEGVPMREEITDAETYLNLMKIRYEGLFDYELYINSKLDIDAFRVPKLFLQPLLELSLIHIWAWSPTGGTEVSGSNRIGRASSGLAPDT